MPDRSRRVGSGRPGSGARHRCMERKKIFRSVWFWVVLVVLVALTFSSFFRGNGGYQEVSTSTALDQFADGNVESATINDKEQTLDLELRERGRRQRQGHRVLPARRLRRRLRPRLRQRRRRRRRLRHQRHPGQPAGQPAGQLPAVPDPPAPAVLAVQLHAGRRPRRHGLRQVQGQAGHQGHPEDDVRRRRRAPTRPSRNCTRSRTSCRTRSSSRPWARRSPRACCCSARPGPARRCSPAPWPARPACRSSRSPARTSSRCSSASAPAASATCSSRPSRTPRRSSSSTRSTPSAGTAAPAWAAGTTSASRRSTRCSSRWTASTSRAA